VFEDQHLNYDRSGNTTQDIFLSNLRNVIHRLTPATNCYAQRRFHGAQEQQVAASNKASEGSVIQCRRCHTYSCTMSDLDLALSVLHDQGVIMVDDYANIGWPGVAIATGAFLQKHQTKIVAVAIGKNKLFICRRLSALLYSNIFQSFCRKHQCKVKGGTASSDQEMYILGPKQEMLPKFG